MAIQFPSLLGLFPIYYHVVAYFLRIATPSVDQSAAASASGDSAAATAAEDSAAIRVSIPPHSRPLFRAALLIPAARAGCGAAPPA
jgi:hypothetical protein